jgi:hypothetical protein
MKRVVLAAIIAAGIGMSVFAADETEQGVSRYFDEGTANFFSLVTSTRVDGTVVLSTKGYQYFLTQTEKEGLQRIIREGLTLIGIAETHKTTIDYERSLGQIYLSQSNGYVTAAFVTRGWAQSAVTLRFLNGGQNINMSLDHGEAQALSTNLALASDQETEIARQVQLFESGAGKVTAATSPRAAARN